MRKIKYRAWDGQKMDYRLPDMIGDDLNAVIEDMQNNYKFLLQYTGLKDKNGEEIYEGDIIKVNDVKVEIKYDNELYAIIGEEINGMAWHDLRYFAGYSEDILIIGNIYENPELLDNKE